MRALLRDRFRAGAGIFPALRDLAGEVDLPDAGGVEAEPDYVRVLAINEQLRSLGQRVTPARVAVATVLARTTDHLGAAEIENRCAMLDPGVHRATVYRALGTLTELGIVSHTHTSAAGAVYHLADGRVPTGHAHLECTVCGRLVDVPAVLLAEVSTRVASEYGFTLEPDHATLLGVCASCDAVREEA